MKGGKRGRQRRPAGNATKARTANADGAKRAAARQTSEPRKRGERVKKYGWSSSAEDAT